MNHRAALNYHTRQSTVAFVARKRFARWVIYIPDPWFAGLTGGRKVVVLIVQCERRELCPFYSARQPATYAPTHETDPKILYAVGVNNVATIFLICSKRITPIRGLPSEQQRRARQHLHGGKPTRFHGGVQDTPCLTT